MLISSSIGPSLDSAMTAELLCLMLTMRPHHDKQSPQYVHTHTVSFRHVDTLACVRELTVMAKAQQYQCNAVSCLEAHPSHVLHEGGP